MRKIIVILAVLFVLIVGVGLIKVLISKDKNHVSSELEKRPHVEVQIPLKKDMSRILVLPGDVVADQEVIIYGHVSGYLDRLEVDRGSWVKEGQVLAQIQIPELMKEFEAQKAALGLAPLEIKKAKADWTWKRAQYERAAELIKKSPNLISQNQVDELKGKYEMARAELKVTKGRYPVLKATMEKTQELVNFSTIKAPFDGVLMDRWVDKGDFVQSGSTKMLHLMKVDLLRVRIDIAQVDVPFVKIGSKVTLTFDEFPAQEWKNEVSRFSWALNQNTKTMMAEIDVKPRICNRPRNSTQDLGHLDLQKYSTGKFLHASVFFRPIWLKLLRLGSRVYCKIWVKNDPPKIRPGMYARVTLELEKHAQVLTLPAAALLVEGDKMFTFVVKEGIAKKIPIKTGFDNGIEIEVSEGLGDQDEVVISGRNLISNGDLVRVTKRGQK